MSYFITVSETQSHYESADGIAFCFNNMQKLMEFLQICLEDGKYITIDYAE